LLVVTDTQTAQCAPTEETAVILRSEAEIRAFDQVARPWLNPRSTITNPDMFLASVDPRHWSPLVVAVSRAGQIIGLAQFKERKFRGIATGLLYGDATLNAMVLSSEADRAQVFRAAVGAVLKRRRVRGLRLVVPPDSPELAALRQLSESYSVELTCGAVENHFSLALEESYASFLAKIGYKTRRNFRYYKRRFDESGHRYVPSMDLVEFEQAAAQLLGKSALDTNRDAIARAMRIFSAAPHPLLAGLQHQDGRWMSIIGGWYEADSAMIFFQMNDDRAHPNSSLSVVMRASLIETLIGDGLQTLRFWAGVAYPLRSYCLPIPAQKAFLDKRGLVWSGSRALLSWLAPLSPTRFKWAADWIGSADSRSWGG
jgi:hypothetical protein